MVRILVAMSVLAAAAEANSQTARTEFFSLEQMQAMCRGESDESPGFRTGASYRLLAQLQRERCRMYLLGVAEGQLQRLEADGRESCLPVGTPEAEVADALVAALTARSEAAGGTVDELVQDALRARYGCL